MEMESVNSVLAGFQESLLPEVERFWIENPDPRTMRWKHGERIRWQGKTGTVSGGVFGEPTLRYCQFDDHTWRTVPAMELEPYTPEQPNHPHPQTPTPNPPHPPHPPHLPIPSPPHRRHSKKGHATGWIEERKGNTKRRVPYTSFYYCWYEVEDLSFDGSVSETRRVKRKEYLQNHLISEVCQMVNDRKPYTEILKVIARSRFDDCCKCEREWR